jgi:serine/threonine protein kinase
MPAAAATVLTGPAAPRAGMRLGGRYRLEGPGGPCPASSWRAVDEVLARPVTVRFLPPGLPLAAAALAPVRAAARLADPRLARIFDADDRGGLPYLVCERAPGRRLDDLLAAGLPAPGLAAAIIAEAADALAVAHAAGVPHLCLTPRSLLWDGSGVKITGLGIDAALRGSAAADPAAADARALGQVLYALLTGYWPGNVRTALPPAPRMRQALCSPRQVRAGLPAPLDAITRRALQPYLPHAEPPFAAPAELAAALRPAGLPAPRRPAPAQPAARRAAPRAVTIPRPRPQPRHRACHRGLGRGLVPAEVT